MLQLTLADRVRELVRLNADVLWNETHVRRSISGLDAGQRHWPFVSHV